MDKGRASFPSPDEPGRASSPSGQSSFAAVATSPDERGRDPPP